MRVISLVVGQLQTNCYVVSDEISGDCLVIDPGDDAQLILQTIQEETLKPKALAATHGHFDHIMAVLELQLALAIPFYVHGKDQFLVKRLRSTARHFVGTDPGPAPRIDGFLDPATPLQVGRSKLQILETPGHTPGGVSLYSLRENIAFVGDTLFAQGGVGRTDYAYANEVKLHQSLAKLSRLPKETKVYPGHGEAFSLGEWQEVVRDVISR